MPQQHPQAATVSDEMSLFNTLDRDAKMSGMDEFMFTHMRGLETRLNEVAKNTLERFSQVDARLQAVEQRAGEQIVRPHESTAEIVVSGLPTRGQLSYEDIVTRIFNFIGATRFLVDVIIRKLNSTKEVRNEVMRLKFLKGNIPVVASSLICQILQKVRSF